MYSLDFLIFALPLLLYKNTAKESTMETSSKPRLQEKFRAVMRLHHYSIRTEKSYWYWIRYFIRFHKLRHPLELGATAMSST
jgi:hypothetical protein